MNCINLLLVVCQGQGDNSVCIRLQKTQHLGKVHWACSQPVFWCQVLLLILGKAKVKFPAACQGKSMSFLCWAEALSLCGWVIFLKVSEFTWAMQAAEWGFNEVWLISSHFYVCTALLISPTDPGTAHPPHMSVLILLPKALEWGGGIPVSTPGLQGGSELWPLQLRAPAWNYLQNPPSVCEFPNLILVQGGTENTPIIKTTLVVAVDQNKISAFCLLHRKTGIGRSEEKASLEQQGCW